MNLPPRISYGLIHPEFDWDVANTLKHFSCMTVVFVIERLNPIIVMCILICVIITTLSVLGSFLSCDKDKILLMKSMKAKKYQIFFKLIVPNSMPDFISVLKINVGMSWVGTIMGEYLVGKAGLGYLIIYGSQIFNLDLVMASTIILCVLAGLMYFLVALIEKYVNKKLNYWFKFL